MYPPGMYTVETSRAGSGILAALANMNLFGKQGLQVINRSQYPRF